MELLDVEPHCVAGKVIGANPRVDHITYLLCILLIARALAAANLPLAFDEAYYWLWSRDLALGYYDHPPMIAFVIRVGTSIFGDTALGVRLVPYLLSIAATWAVWQSAFLLTERQSAGAIAALIYNLTLMVSVQALVATPDAPSMAAAAFFMFCLVKVSRVRHPGWWILSGFAAGLALLSKYTAPFLGLGALLWLALARGERRWLVTAWPYLGAAIALLIFTPNLWWNAQNDWVSLSRQLGRTDLGGELTLRFFGEFLAAQLGLATPFIAVVMTIGLWRVVSTSNARQSGPALIGALVVPAIVYFLWHSLHGRVEGNWPSFLYPMLAVAAALAWASGGDDRSSRVLRFARAAAVPVALAMTSLVYFQASTGILPMQRDPLARLLAVGYKEVAEEIDAIGQREGARAALTTGYAQTGWLSFYLPSRMPVFQYNERERWGGQPVPELGTPLLYFTEEWRDLSEELSERYGNIVPIARIPRVWHGRTVDTYIVYRVEAAP